MILEFLWLAALGVNLIPFGAYIVYMQWVANTKPWNISVNPSYRPFVSIIIPTYNEEDTIRTKLDNLLEVDYPREKMKLIVVDSASSDRTVPLTQDWAGTHKEIDTQIVVQPERSGMVNALNEALKHVTGEVVVKSDADCLLLRDSLVNAAKYISDPSVGSVAGLHIIRAGKETTPVKTERQYREFYRTLRIGESKLYGTVLYEGELMLVKRDLLEKIGFDEEIGADDVPTALRLAELGYRAITAPDAFFVEMTPYTWREKFDQKVRRARHVFQSLWKYKYLIFQKKDAFHSLIMPFEFYIYALNPFVTVVLVGLTVAVIVRYPWIALFTGLLLVQRIRDLFVTHLVNSSIMVIAIIGESLGKEKTTWRKIEEIRPK